MENRFERLEEELRRCDLRAIGMSNHEAAIAVFDCTAAIQEVINEMKREEELKAIENGK